MGQSLSRRRPAPTSTAVSAPTVAPGPAQPSETQSPRRSLPHRILSSIPKPSLRSRPSLTLPTRPEQTLRRKSRRWRLSRRHDAPASMEGAIPEHMGRLAEHEEHQVDRDVDEFGVITHRVPDNHTDSPAASAKGKERAKDPPDVEDDDKVDPVPSTSTAPPLTRSGAARNPADDDEVVIAPPAPSPPRQPSPSPPSEHPSVLLPPELIPPSHPSIPQANANPRPFPPPGTLVVVQGVVHTTDVPRSSDRPSTTLNPIPFTTYDPPTPSINTDLNSMRPSSVSPESRLRSPLSGILPRPTSMAASVPLPSEPTISSSIIESQAGQTTSNANSATEDSEDEDRTRAHPHGFSVAQGPVGASGLSASSVDVLGTLLSVAAAATAASLLTGSSEPIFSSGLTSSQPPPSSNSIPQTAGFNPNVPSERPLSPTPTSDAGRMRHVWSSLRDRFGLGSGAHNSNHANDTTSNLGPGQPAPPEPSNVTRPRDPREIMLAEMARAFNLGLGLGGATAGTPFATASANTELATPDGGDAGRDGEQSSFPPPDSFERFLMDLQTDLRIALMHEEEPGVIGGTPQDTNETAEEVEGDQPIPELQSLSDSDSEEFGTRHFQSDDEDQLDCEDAEDEGDEGDVRTAQEQPSGRTSPAVSALGTGTQCSLGAGSRLGTPSFGASSVSVPRTVPSRSTSTAISPGAECEGGNNSADNGENGGIGTGTHVPAGPSDMLSEEEPEGREGMAVLGVVHSREASYGGQRVEVEGCRTISGPIAVLPLDEADPSNVPETGAGQDSLLPGTLSSSDPSTFNAPRSFPGSPVIPSQPPTLPSAVTVPPSSDLGRATRTSSSASPITRDSSMPFRLPFTPSSASRTEHTPGGGINWWRMYRFPAITSPNPGQQGGPPGPSPLSQIPFRNSAQGSSTSPWAHTAEQNQQNEMASRGVVQAPDTHSGLAQPSLAPSATLTNMPEIVSASGQSTNTPASTSGPNSIPPTNTSTNPPEHRSNVVVPVIVVGLQSVNMDRQAAEIPPPNASHGPVSDDEDGMEFDGLEPSMSMPLHIPEPAEFRHHSSTSNQEQSGQQPSRGRTWQSRAANAIRNLRPSRRNADVTSPSPQEAPGSRTFLIYVIGGYYPPDHQIITGGNLDSFEALWELAELLGQVKPPTVSKEEIEKSGLEIINASMLDGYEKQGRVASNCIDRCLICLDDYTPDDVLRVLTCKHTFHQGCVDRWLETGRNNCPACRTKGVGNESAGPTSATSDAIA